jgi:DNA mismatch endonuclease (patch repair protein)
LGGSDLLAIGPQQNRFGTGKKTYPMPRAIVNRLATLPDRLTPAQRSAHMAGIKGKRNRSTELHVAAKLVRAGVRGWRRHPNDVPGRPDFAFPERRIALFVDGCFWHGCPRGNRNTPRTRAEFWQAKIAAKRTRDRTVDRHLRAQGYRIVRIWEHALRDGQWLDALLALLAKRGRERHGNNLSK